MQDSISDLANKLKGRRISVPESFADDVMHRIELQKEGGLKSLPVPARILLSTVVVAMYCSLGILLGVTGYKNLKPEVNSSSQNAIVELMDSHHMSSDLLHDQLFINLNLKK